MNPKDAHTTVVTLSRGELMHLKSWAESVDVGTDGDVAFWDRLVAKLENAIARIDRPRAKPRRSKPYEADDQPAVCRRCGWKGPLKRTSPCPGCGVKLNPIFYQSKGATT